MFNFPENLEFFITMVEILFYVPLKVIPFIEYLLFVKPININHGVHGGTRKIRTMINLW